MTESSKVGPGTVLAERYELIDIIGRGGFGTVWRARQLNMGREVAIKILPPRFLAINDVVERFKREAMLASRLRHPNTITLHDYGQHDNLLYIVMEILSGEDLADVLKREGRLPPKRIMHISRQVLKSLAEAHEQHIVHRDLKPENIFLSVVGDDRDHVKVLDFGIAKLAQPTKGDMLGDNNRRLTMSGSTVGTPTYMSPEQAAGEEVDGLTDLYALGIIMYEMACGRPPFYDKEPVKIMRAQLFEPVPPMRDESLRGSVLDRVIQKSLAKDREERFQSAHEMLLALAGEPVARPVIQGIAADALDGLGEPSTQDMVIEDLQEESAPNTDDFEPNEQKKFPNTLGFAASVKRPQTEQSAKAQSAESEDENPDDAVPFASISGAEARKKRETVRSNVTSGSGLTSESGLSGAPKAIAPPSAEETTSSSILTVIESDESSDDDVILLTRKKEGEESQERPALQDEPAVHDEETEHAAAAPVETIPSDGEDAADVGDAPRNSAEMVAFHSGDETPLQNEPSEGSLSTEESDSWEWGRAGADVPEEQPPAQRSSSAAWVIVLALLIVVAAAVLFYDELAAMMFR